MARKTLASLTRVDEVEAVLDGEQEWTVQLADALHLLPLLPAESIDAVVTDPPYELGFMGKSWDAAGVSFQPETWAEVLRVLKPGGHLLAFGGTRTSHRIAVAIEDAGFEIRDSMLYWGYGCLSDDSEILTKNGWKRGIDVEVGELVANWDSATESVTLEPVEEVVVGPYTGPMVKFKHSNVDQLLTPNHRVYHSHLQRPQRDGVREEFYAPGWDVAEAGSLNRWQSIRFPASGLHDGVGIGEDYARLLAWVWTEGGFDRTGTGVRIYQSPSANPEHTDAIDGLMRKIVPEHKRYDRERPYSRGGVETVVSEACWFFTGELASKVRSDLPEKHPTYGLLWRMTLAEKRAFIEAAMAGDGSGNTFYQTDRDDREWFQTLAHMTGARAQVYNRPNRDGGHVDLTARSTYELQKCHLKDATEDYDGDVWCVKVRTGAFVARRNGKIFVTGNSGFPKSLNVGKAIEKVNGDGVDWNGFGTALKPAYEPIIVARKPLRGTVAANVLEHGTGALNIDGCRIAANGDKLGGGAETGTTAGQKGVEGWTRPWMDDEEMRDAHAARVRANVVKAEELGRWPANVILSHSEHCVQVGTVQVKDDNRPNGNGRRKSGFVNVGSENGDGEHNGPVYGDAEVGVWACVPGCPVRTLDEQVGMLKSGKGNVRRKSGANRDGNTSAAYGAESRPEGSEMVSYGDAGGASRFFYCAKAAKKERNAGLEAFGRDVSVRTPMAGRGQGGLKCRKCGHWKASGSPCRCLEPDFEQMSFDRPEVANHHPTVKPIEVMRWLVRLVTPPKGVVLDLFTGSGTTGCAARLEGFRFVGVEREPEYVPIARARIEHWEAQA